MSRKVTLSARCIKPRDLTGSDSFGMTLVGWGYPIWWPDRGESVHITITESHMITTRIREAISVMRYKLALRGSLCTIEFEKVT